MAAATAVFPENGWAPDASLKGDVVFQAWTGVKGVYSTTGFTVVLVADPSRAPTASPAPGPTPRPTKAPTHAPTTAGLKVTTKSSTWMIDEAQFVYVDFTGVAESGACFFDVTLFDAATESVAATLAEGAEDADCDLTLKVSRGETASLAAGTYFIRATEYTHGYVADSSAVSVSSTEYPTPDPTLKPTSSPIALATPRPTYTPTAAPTASSLSVAVSGLGATASSGDAVSLAFAYTGELAKESGYLTLRLCYDKKSKVTAYNGAADDYDNCDAVAQFLWSASFDETYSYAATLPDGLVEGGTYYFRADSTVDRSDADDAVGAYGAYALSFRGGFFTAAAARR